MLRAVPVSIAPLSGLLLLVACGTTDNTPADASSEAPPGRLVIVGGGLDADNAEVYRAVVEARDGTGPLCVFPTASGVPEESMSSAVDRLREHGGPDVEVTGIWITTENPEAASRPAVVDSIAACSGYWFVGGSQSRVMEAFRPTAGDTPGYRALMRRWREGAVVSGSSAGASMMSSRSIGGGSPEEALAVGVARDEDGDWEADGDGVWVMHGMDFVPWAIVGQHHLARGRWGRLVVAVMTEPDDLGVGIDENTALVVDHRPEGPTGRVVGASSVLLVDVSDAEVDPGARTATGIRLELLGAGDALDLETGEVTRVREGRTPPDGSIDPSASGDPDSTLVRPSLEAIEEAPFERWALLHLLNRMAAGEVTDVTLDGGARELDLRTGDGFVALADPDGEPVEGAGTPHALSMGPLVLDVRAPAD
jgi:cyanophycinase